MECYSAQSQPDHWRYVFGDRWTFAVEMECEVTPPRHATWGTIWMWVDGSVVGNTNRWEHLGIGARWLYTIGEQIDKRPNRIFAGLSPSARLDAFLWWYRECEGVCPVDGWSPEEGLDPDDYLVSEVNSGPVLDDWRVIIAREEDKEILTWRYKDNGETYEFELQAGYFLDVCSSAYLFLKANEPEVL